MLEKLLQHGSAGKRRPPRQHVENCASKRVEIAPHVDVARVARLLGADVVEGSQGHPALSQPMVGLALEPPSQAHVNELGAPRGVRMMFEGLMSRWTTPRAAGVDQGLANLECDVHRLDHRQRSALVHSPADRDPFDVFKCDEMIWPSWPML